jgi:hypothetical protein
LHGAVDLTADPSAFGCVFFACLLPAHPLHLIHHLQHASMNLSQSGPNPPELLIASHLPLNLNEKSIGDGLILSRWDSLLSESQIEAAGLPASVNSITTGSRKQGLVILLTKE